MRESYYARPLREFIDTLLDIEQHQPSANSQVHELSWALELLLLDDRSPEREWRQAAAQPLVRLLNLLETEHQERTLPPTQVKTDPCNSSWMDWDQVRLLIAELAY